MSAHTQSEQTLLSEAFRHGWPVKQGWQSGAQLECVNSF